MAGDYTWPVSMLPGNVPAEVRAFFEAEFEEHRALGDKYNALYREYEEAKALIGRQERYIAELEKQLQLLQKTLDMVDKNMRHFPDGDAHKK